MLAKQAERQKAIQLRKRGLSYSEILKHVPVSKSTISLWLRTVRLTPQHIQRLKEKKLIGTRKASETIRNRRIQKTAFIKQQAADEVESISKRELWLIGTALYWAEGTKQKEHNPGQAVVFTNSDPLMIKLFLKWLTEIVRVRRDSLKFDIYIHENAKNRLSEVAKYWSKIVNISVGDFHFCFKKVKPKIIRRNIGDSYNGLIRIYVRKSIDLNRKISGWAEGICKYCRVV